ncbi:penicillin-binding protein 2 [Candidatus Berkelbacteria bacterium RIFCSPHIGHO2_12_FULL_36_9]|uniref:Penicillin-binding protein 2 n=1 Tax=Candidatus Berkelbacteria bacterium RIFCSPHIGHO2_12_FULL_36_9 TaxID=1797469 RepID=A0A1F5EJ35_9BACT|nr:MAG: penicillin-binding protein 2 [Candidatus Berkelbacteria bacterium RIFCSPHIGHO2_12_FULL_36_9]
MGKIVIVPEEYEHQSNLEPKDVLEEEKEKPDFSLFYVFSMVMAIIFLFKLTDLQVVQSAKYQYLAEGNRIRSRDIFAPRGIIYDRNGQVLAQNIASFNLEIYPADLPKEKESRQEIYKKIEDTSKINTPDIKERIEKEGLFSIEPIILKENLSRDEALYLKVKYHDVMGVEVAYRPSRQYQTTPGLSHFLGYIGKISEKELVEKPTYQMNSWLGKTGLEFIYEDILKGTNGKKQMEVDSKGYIQRVLADLPPKSGNNIYLGLDLDLQKETAFALEEMIKQLNVKNAVAIAMDPRDGSILTMVSLPSYDNNIFTQGLNPEEYQKLLNDPSKPLINRAIAGVYPAGSTVKPFIASAALQEKTISEKTTLDTSIGEIRIGEWVFPDWKRHGVTDVKKAIAESNDIFFYALGGGYEKIKGLGIERMDKYLQLFGFNKETGIDLNGEEEGLIPSPEWKKKVKKESWYLGDSYHLAIGQGDFLATPLELLNAIWAVANGGELLKPHLIKYESDQNGNIGKEFPKQIIRKDFIEGNNLRIVREGMRQTVTEGSARQLVDLPASVAGKTGTAQFDKSDRTHAWFIGFAPYENPEIAVVVLVEAGGEGHTAAVPVARKMFEKYFSKTSNSNKQD